MIPFAANKSLCALLIICSQPMVPGFSTCSLRYWKVGLSRVVLLLAVRVVGFAIGDFVNVRGVCDCKTCS